MPIMNKETFMKKVAEILELEPSDLAPETDFREASEEWSSLMGFALLVFLEDECNAKIDVSDFEEEKLKTIGDLLRVSNIPC